MGDTEWAFVEAENALSLVVGQGVDQVPDLPRFGPDGQFLL